MKLQGQAVAARGARLPLASHQPVRRRPGRLSVVVAACLLAAAAGAATPAAERNPESLPRLVVPEPRHDAGDVYEGEIVEVELEIQNHGAGLLVVEAVQPTCGCSLAAFSPEIPAGESGFVVLTVDTAGFSGPISKSALILTNDPVSPTAEVVVDLVVRAVLTVLPDRVVRFDVPHGAGASAKLTVVSEMTDRLTITGIESSAPYLSAVVRPLGAGEQGAGPDHALSEVTVVLGAEAPAGPLRETIALHTDNEMAPRVDVVVVGRVHAAGR